MTNETTKVTEETMEMVVDNGVEVIQAAEDIVSGNDINLGKVGKGAAVAVVVGTVLWAGYKYGVPFVKKLIKKDKPETVDCESEEYAEAIDEEDVAVEDLNNDDTIE